MISLTIHDSICGHPSRSLKVVRYAHNASLSLMDQFFLVGLTDFSKFPFLSMRYLDLTTYLWVVRGGNLMNDRKFEHKFFKNLIAKMLLPITYNGTWYAKLSKNILFQKLDHYFVVISSTCFDFYPFWNIVDNDKDVHITKKNWKWSHEIYTPYIKNFNDQNQIEGHHVSF